MVEEGYSEELLKEKINSMRQLDRIEYNQGVNSQKNYNNFYVISQKIIGCVILIISFFGLVWLSIIAYNSIIGIDYTLYIIPTIIAFLISGFLFIGFIKNEMSLRDTIKELQEQNEQFIKEHTK